MTHTLLYAERRCVCAFELQQTQASSIRCEARLLISFVIILFSIFICSCSAPLLFRVVDSIPKQFFLVDQRMCVPTIRTIVSFATQHAINYLRRKCQLDSGNHFNGSHQMFRNAGRMWPVWSKRHFVVVIVVVVGRRRRSSSSFLFTVTVKWWYSFYLYLIPP